MKKKKAENMRSEAIGVWKHGKNLSSAAFRLSDIQDKKGAIRFFMLPNAQEVTRENGRPDYIAYIQTTDIDGDTKGFLEMREKRTRGHWHITEEYISGEFRIQEYLTCSECGKQLCGSGIEPFPYCPYCGSEMEDWT